VTGSASTPRDAWATRAGFILSAVGSAVGLGNMWRFAYKASEGGGAAFVLVYLAMVAQLRSFRVPLIIMFSVPLGFIGVIAALKLTVSRQVPSSKNTIIDQSLSKRRPNMLPAPFRIIFLTCRTYPICDVMDQSTCLRFT